MFRQPAQLPPPDSVPTELVYAAVNRGLHRNSAVALFKLITMPGVVGMALATVASPEVGFVGLVVAGLATAWWWRIEPYQEGAVLRREGDAIVLLSRDGKQEKARFRPNELAYVELDTKEIQHVQEGNGPVPGLRFIQSTVGPEIENARIVLIVRGQMIALTEEYLAYTETIDWFSKIRLFLRKQGWVVPIDEASPAADDARREDVTPPPRKRARRKSPRPRPRETTANPEE
jgi:hypothetical protein